MVASFCAALVGGFAGVFFVFKLRKWQPNGKDPRQVTLGVGAIVAVLGVLAALDVIAWDSFAAGVGGGFGAAFAVGVAAWQRARGAT